VLSPQERQIAEMAASGMSNREIGQHLYLSHRTVATHLYRIFPKLGITSRFQMPQALRALSGVQP
jgi:DNA-binding NarL/FixJ family response regulator